MKCPICQERMRFLEGFFHRIKFYEFKISPTLTLRLKCHTYCFQDGVREALIFGGDKK